MLANTIRIINLIFEHLDVLCVCLCFGKRSSQFIVSYFPFFFIIQVINSIALRVSLRTLKSKCFQQIFNHLFNGGILNNTLWIYSSILFLSLSINTQKKRLTIRFKHVSEYINVVYDIITQDFVYTVSVLKTVCADCSFKKRVPDILLEIYSRYLCYKYNCSQNILN